MDVSPLPLGNGTIPIVPIRWALRLNNDATHGLKAADRTGPATFLFAKNTTTSLIVIIATPFLRCKNGFFVPLR